MAFSVKIPHLICIFAMLVVAPCLTVGYRVDVEKFNQKGMESFGNRLFSELAQENPNQNIICSPLSIQTGLTMVRIGAEGQTAEEMDQALSLSAQNPEVLANNYHDLLLKYKDSSFLTIANKIYVMIGYSVQATFNQLMTDNFFSKVDSINFANKAEAAGAINTYVEGKTNNLIKNVINPDSLGASTRLVLVNVIHFKGNWVHPFPEHATSEADFYLDDTNAVKVQMMRVENYFRYAELDNLDAKVLEMHFKDSFISMLVILPNKRTGLEQLEDKLIDTSLNAIVKNMSLAFVDVQFPKFKADFEAELKEPLSSMGMERMFSANAELGKILESGEGLQVSSVIHKTVIDVNEFGAEAAAATAISVGFTSGIMHTAPPKVFRADRPFYYSINSASDLTFFKGVYKNNL